MNDVQRHRAETLVIILDGNSEHVAHAKGKYFFFEEKQTKCDCFLFNHMSLAVKKIEITSNVRHTFWLAITYGNQSMGIEISSFVV